MLEFKMTRPCNLGLLPVFASPGDPRDPVEQIHQNYAHGGGWNDFKGFKLEETQDGDYQLQYPGDPPMKELAYAFCRNFVIILFEYEWVAVLNKDTGDYRVARLD